MHFCYSRLCNTLCVTIDYMWSILILTNRAFLLSVVDVSTTNSDEEVFKNIVGTIVSPNYPRNYGNNEKRYYKIIAPMQSEIVLIFNNFDVEYHDECASDSLTASVSPFSIAT